MTNLESFWLGITPELLKVFVLVVDCVHYNEREEAIVYGLLKTLVHVLSVGVLQLGFILVFQHLLYMYSQLSMNEMAKGPRKSIWVFRYFDILKFAAVSLNNSVHKQTQRIVVPHFQGLIVWGAIIKSLVPRLKLLVWTERHHHKKCTYEIHISNGAKVTSNVEVLKYVGQKSWSRSQGQNL